MKKLRWIAVVVCVVLAMVGRVEASGVEAGKKVKFDYKLTIDGQVIESSEGKQPIEYTHGEAQIIPGLSAALEGMNVGDNKTVTIEPDQGYGTVKQDAFKEVPKKNFPEDFKFEVGSVIELQSPDGGVFPGVISAIKEEAVVVNFNHPLAGKTLVFDISIVGIE